MTDIAFAKRLNKGRKPVLSKRETLLIKQKSCFKKSNFFLNLFKFGFSLGLIKNILEKIIKIK